MQSFDDFFNARKKAIAKMCLIIDKETNNRIEYEDLFQEASLKLLQIYRNKEPLDINYSLKAVENCLIDYVKKNSNDNVVSVGLAYDIDILINSIKQ